MEMENVTFNIHHQTTCTWYNWYS